MPDYSKSKIYKLYSLEYENLFYIGSTCQKFLSVRLAGHVQDYNRYLKNKRKYTTSFKIIETGNYKIELLEAFPCNSKDELIAREGYYIRKNPDCVNKIIAGRTKKEYLEDNKEKLKDKKKEYYQNNKEHLLKKNREWKEKNREKIKAKKKEYYQNNKEKIKEYNKKYIEKNPDYGKEYREENREKIKAKKSEPFLCACGSECRRDSKHRHFRTAKHKKWEESQPKN